MSIEPRDKELEAGAEIEVAKGEHSESENVHKTTIHRAKAATEKEHRMTLWAGIRTYPKAIGWSCLISMCIAMEAFDLCLLNTFCMSPLQGRLGSSVDVSQLACLSSKKNSERSNRMVPIKYLLRGRQDSRMEDKRLSSLA